MDNAVAHGGSVVGSHEGGGGHHGFATAINSVACAFFCIRPLEEYFFLSSFFWVDGIGSLVLNG